MTAIAGWIEDNVAYLAADTCVTYATDQQGTAHKLAAHNDLIIGVGGNKRYADLIRHVWTPPPYRPGPVEAWMVSVVVPSIRSVITDHGYMSTTSGRDDDYGGTVLIGYAGSLWTIRWDGAVLQETQRYAAIGSGGRHAVAALATTAKYAPHLSPAQHLHHALQVASRYTSGVRSPYHIVSTAEPVVVELDP